MGEEEGFLGFLAEVVAVGAAVGPWQRLPALVPVSALWLLQHQLQAVFVQLVKIQRHVHGVTQLLKQKRHVTQLRPERTARMIPRTLLRTLQGTTVCGIVTQTYVLTTRERLNRLVLFVIIRKIELIKLLKCVFLVVF